MSYTKTPKTPLINICETCDFKCSNKKDYNRHLLTAKHKRITNDYDNDYKIPPSHACECGKEYKHRQGLYAHKQKCTIKTPETPENPISSPPPENRIVYEHVTESMVIKCFQTMMAAQAAQMVRDEAQTAQTAAAVVRDEMRDAAQTMRDAAQTVRDEAQAEQTRLLIEAISLKGPQCITNNTTNNQFNLNVFLNEDCKDAYTLKEVIESIVCTVEDLDRLIVEGYAATVIRKILESMQDMAITERPIHCTDLRRNIVCVKSAKGWEKGEAALKLLNNTLYFVGKKLGNVVPEWRETYPDHFRGTDSRRNQYHKLIVEVTKVDDVKLEDRNVGIICRSLVLDRKTAKAGIM